MGNNLLTQVVLIITAITIVVTYIRPSFTDIADVQDDIIRYETTVAKAAELNAALGELIDSEQSISSRESDDLFTYLPTEIDDVLIMRDIQNVFKTNNLTIMGLSSASGDSFEVNATVEGRNDGPQEEGAPSLIFRDFELAFFGQYDDLKLILAGLESNSYPLEVVEMAFTTAEEVQVDEVDIGLPPGTMRYDITLRAFALPQVQ